MIEYDLLRPVLLTVDDDGVRDAIDNFDAARATQRDESPPRDHNARRRAEAELAQERQRAILERRTPTMTATHVHRAVNTERDAERHRAAFQGAVVTCERQLDNAVWQAAVPMLDTVFGEFVRRGWPNPLPRDLELLWTAFGWPAIDGRPGELVHDLNASGRNISNVFRIDQPDDRRHWWPIPPGATRYATDMEHPVWWQHVIAQITAPRGKGYTVTDDGVLRLRNPEPAWQGHAPWRPGTSGRPHRGVLVWVGNPGGYSADQQFR